MCVGLSCKFWISQYCGGNVYLVRYVTVLRPFIRLLQVSDSLRLSEHSAPITVTAFATVSSLKPIYRRTMHVIPST